MKTFWICLCLDNCSVICKVTLCYINLVLHQTHSEFWYIQNYLFRYIQGYAALLRDIHAYWAIVKPYSGLFRHIQHHCIFTTIFWALAYLGPESYSKSCEILIRHIQNPATVATVITVYSGIIQPYSEHCIMLTYAEIWHIQNPGIFGSLP